MTTGMLLLLLQGAGCAYITDEHAAERLDMDEDGVKWPRDCDDTDPDVTTVTWYRDIDEDGYGDTEKPYEDCEAPDGYVEADGDCDDEDADRNPGQHELCNDIDDNCNNLVDDNPIPITFYRDFDEDGHGDPEDTIQGCDAPPGYVEVGDDCDDTNPNIYPDATEFCDLVDQDCDGNPLDPESVDASTWYLDDDGDLYGDPGSSTTGCEAPTDYVGNDLDCDDTRDDVNPDAVEVCDRDDTDEDCVNGADDDDPNVDPESQITYYEDLDGDGYGNSSVSQIRCDADPSWSTTSGDCDDTDAHRNPGAPEECDTDDLDEDCNDLADDDDPGVAASTLTTWYPDRDGDGYGDVDEVGVDLCDATSEYPVDNDTDCDDGDFDINPGVSEVCDPEDTDENCNGVADDDDSSTIDLSTWYQDGDNDGYGGTSFTTDACEVPDGFTDTSTDCDDGNADVHPDAQEIWYDGTDQDCAGDDDYDADADGHQSEDWGGDDCEDADPSANPSQTEVCSDGIDNDCDDTSNGCGLSGSLTTADTLAALSEVSSSDKAGEVVTWAPDLDGDGTDEMLVGAPNRSSNGSKSGSVYLVFGPVTTSTDLGSVGIELWGASSNELAGTSLGAIGDADGTGTPGFLVGSPENSTYETDAGVAWLVVGNPGGDMDLGAAIALYGDEREGQAGNQVAVAEDVNDDGFEDLLVAGPRDDSESEGMTWLVHGPVSGDLLLNASFGARIVGESPGDESGTDISSAGDTNQDGFADLLIGAPRDDTNAQNAGAAYVWLGPVSGDLDLADATAKLLGEATSDYAGSAVDHVGDIDGDGYDDIGVGSSSSDTYDTDAGAIYVLRGPVTADGDLASADFILTGEAAQDGAGNAFDEAGDIDGDGAGDLVVAAASYEPSGGSNNGAAYLLYGPLTGSGTLGSEADVFIVGDEGFTGWSVAGGRDGNGDGYDDILLGSLGAGVWLLVGEGL